MPLTVITLKNSTASLRGDLSKWMQEIATGVYVGNFNSRVREQLWQRVQQSVGKGEATLTYAYRNEIGYQFETYNTHREVIDADGIPLVFYPMSPTNHFELKSGFSKAAKYRKTKQVRNKNLESKLQHKPYIVIDIETEGLDVETHSIIEVAALKVENKKISWFTSLVCTGRKLTKEIEGLTGITSDDLKDQGKPLQQVMEQFLVFIGDDIVVGYNLAFDISFINRYLKENKQKSLRNQRVDLKKYVKREKMFLDDYALETVLEAYGIDAKVPHRAFEDAKLIYMLSSKVKKFMGLIR